MKKVKALIDTNILFGYHNRIILVELYKEGLCELIWSPAIIGELYRILTIRALEENRDKNTISRQSKNMMKILTKYYRCSDPNPNSFEYLYLVMKEDKDDIPIAAAAIHENVDYLVTSNTNDFKSLNTEFKFKSIRCLNFKEFLDDIGFISI